MPIQRLILLVCLVLSTLAFFHFGRRAWVPVYHRLAGGRTVAEVAEQYGPAADEKLKKSFRAVNVSYPPASLALLGFKEEKVLEVWAPRDREWVRVLSFPILKASGKAGPKLKEGDRQVPEGIYQLEGLNPNSSFHLSMKVSYPNAFDREKAKEDGRTRLGGDIFIHGGAASIGCLAMGDEAIEELFVLVHRVGLRNVRVLLAPHDLRRLPAPVTPGPVWVPGLYDELREALAAFKTH